MAVSPQPVSPHPMPQKGWRRRANPVHTMPVTGAVGSPVNPIAVK